jgi:hypothetical protein
MPVRHCARNHAVPNFVMLFFIQLIYITSLKMTKLFPEIVFTSVRVLAGMFFLSKASVLVKGPTPGLASSLAALGSLQAVAWFLARRINQGLGAVDIRKFDW